MKSIISGVITIVFVVGGVVGADFLKADPVPAGAADHAEKKGDDGQGKDGKKKDDHGDGYGEEEADNSGARYYFDFSRQFVVPVVDYGKISALVIMDITLELDQSDSDGMYTLEAKFRDALMRELLSLSNDGAFSGQMTDPAKYDMISKRLLKASRTVRDEVKAVLILDIARQDQV